MFPQLRNYGYGAIALRRDEKKLRNDQQLRNDPRLEVCEADRVLPRKPLQNLSNWRLTKPQAVKHANLVKLKPDCACAPACTRATATAYSSPTLKTRVKNLDLFDPRIQMRQNLLRLKQKQEMMQGKACSDATRIAAAAYVAACLFAQRAHAAIQSRLRIDAAAAAASQAARVSVLAVRASFAAADGARNVAKKSMRVLVKQAAQAAQAAAMEAAQFTLLVVGAALKGVESWLAEQELLTCGRRLQEMVTDRLRKNTIVSVNLLHNRIDINEAMNFKGGTADVLEEDLHVMEQISNAIKVVYECVDCVNDELEEAGKPRTFTMPHLRVEGHVHRSRKSTQESLSTTSQARAEAVVKHVVSNGVPRRYLHPQGFGASKPHRSGKPEDNRRVEIHVMGLSELHNFINWKFNTYDVDKSGFLDKHQVTKMAIDMGKTMKQIESDFNEMDKDRTGKIWLEELREWFLAT